MYWYDQHWNIATSGTPDALGECNSDPKKRTFKQLFWDTWEELGYQLPQLQHKNITFIFELMTPYNKVVVQHPHSRIVLHGLRFNDGDMEEMWPESVEVHYPDWEVVDSTRLRTGPDKIQQQANDLGPGTKAEGFVVVDHLFHRVKVKNVDYLRLHRMVDGMSTRKMLEIIRTNESDEFLIYFPEWTDLYKEVTEKYHAVIATATVDYHLNKDLPSQKEFALAVKHLPYSGALFGVKSGRYKTFKEYFATMNIKSLEQLLGLKGEPNA